MKIEGLRAGAGWVLRALGAVLGGLMLLAPAGAGAVSLTSVQGTVYRADGTPASGTLLVSWPGFSTSRNEAVAAGSLTVMIGTDGYVQVSLAPNAGAYPESSYYTAVYHLSDGTVSKEYWVVPAAVQAAVASVRAVLAPSTVATQSVSKSYVDTALAGVGNTYLSMAGGALNGPLTLNADPISNGQAANKHYTDQTVAQVVATAMPLKGGAMNGPLLLNADPSVSLGAATKSYVDASASMATAAIAQIAANVVPLAGGVMSGALTAPSINNLPSAASQAGGINGWIAATTTSGKRSWLWIDPQFASGAPTSALTSLTHLIDARGTNNYAPGSGLNFPDGALGFYSAATAQQPLASASYVTNVNHGFDCSRGGIYNYIGTGGTKSNCVNVYVGSDFRTAAQHYGIFGSQNGYGGGENISANFWQNNYAGFIGPGQEQDEAIRIQAQQGSETDGLGGIWKGTATGVNSGTGVVTFTASLNAQTLGETRFIRDLGSVYSTGTLTSIVCSGSPATCTVTGSGTGWTAISGFVSTHTTFASATYLAPILTNNLVICIDGSANDGFDACMPIISGTDDTHLQMAVTEVGTNATAWWGATTGTYHIYRSAYPTSTDRVANTFTACGTTYLAVTTCDVSGITSGHTLDQVLAYNEDVTGIQLLLARHIGKPNAYGGINIVSMNPLGTAPPFNYGVAVSGSILCALCIQSYGAGSEGNVQYGMFSYADPTVAWLYSQVISATPTTFAKFINSAGAALVPFQFVRDTGAANYGLSLFGTATINPAGGFTMTALKDTGVGGGGNQCLHTDSSGNITGTGTDCAGGSPLIMASYPTGDILCAHGGDTTIGLMTITAATNAAPPVFTATGAVGPNGFGYMPGQSFVVSGVTPGAYNGTYTVGANPTGTLLTGSGAAPGAAYVTGGTINMVCNNSSDALNTSLGTFATTLSIALTPPVHDVIDTQWALYTPATAPAVTLPKLVFAGRTITGFAANSTTNANATGFGGSVSYMLSSPSAGLVYGALNSETIGSAPGLANVAAAQFITTGTPQTVSLTSGFVGSGLGSITSGSGGTISGVGTCNLASFNNGLTSATATVRFITSGSWAGAAFTITNGSFGGTASPTSATLTSGTAACSGTPSLVTVLGGAWGTALRLIEFSVKQQ